MLPIPSQELGGKDRNGNREAQGDQNEQVNIGLRTALTATRDPSGFISRSTSL